MREKRLAILLLLLATVLVYGNSLGGSFHYDDVPPIIETPAIHDLGNWFEIITAQRGLSMMSFAVNYAIGGFDVTGYHLFNLLVHAVNAVLVYLLCCSLLIDSRIEFGDSSRIRPTATPFFAALFFAVHPLQTQAVTYIAQRMESLAAMFILAGLLCFVAGVRADSRVRRGVAFVGVIACLLAGFAAKETAIVLPLLVLLVDWLWLSNGNWRKLLSRRWVHASLLAVMLLLAGKTLHLLGGVSAVGSGAGTVKATAGFAVSSISAWQYALTQTNVLLYYISLVLLPINQNLDYDFPVARDLFSWPVLREGTVLNWPPLPPILALLLLLGMLCGVYAWYRRARFSDGHGARVTLFGLLWFLIAIAPTSSVIPVIDVIYEHRAYLASIGLILILTYALDQLTDRLSPMRNNLGDHEPSRGDDT